MSEMSTYGQPKQKSGGLLTFAGVMILVAGIFKSSMASSPSPTPTTS